MDTPDHLFHTGSITDEDVRAMEQWCAEHCQGKVLRGGTDIERFYPEDDPALCIATTQLLKESDDPDGPMGPRKVTYRHVGRYEVCNLLYGGRTLELAAGSGYGHAIIARSPWVTELVSLEGDYLSCLYAHKHFRHPQKGTLVCGRVPEQLPGGTFDTIVMIELFEHLTKDDQEQLTPQLHASLNPGGLLIATTPYAKQDGPNPKNPYHLYERTRESFVSHFEEYFDTVQDFVMGRQTLTEGTVHDLGFLLARK